MSMNRTMVLLLVLGVAGGVLHVKNRFFKRPAPTEIELVQAMPADAVPRGAVVEVYGRNGCAITRRMLVDLKTANVPVRYHDIDAVQELAGFHARFENAGLMRNGSYALPVVAVAGQSYARPSSSSVVYRYNAR
jgi:hypothetical protein